ncbi:MAG: hypothetical protein ABEJ65_11645, partial [bacterium]
HGGDRIDHTVRDMIEQSRNNQEIRLSREVREATDTLRNFMFENLYLKLGESPIDLEAYEVFSELYHFFADNPEKMYQKLPYLESIDSPDLVADFMSLQSDLSTIKMYRKYIGNPLENLPEYV